MPSKTNLRHLLVGSLLPLAALAGCIDLDLSPPPPDDGGFNPPPVACSEGPLVDTSGEAIDLCATESLPESACTPGESSKCAASGSRCLAMGKAPEGGAFALRMSQLTISQPSAFTGGGLVSHLLRYLVEPDRIACHLEGQGSLSWLLRFDLDAGTLTTGGAPPPADPRAGYSFLRGAVDDHGTFRFVAPASAKLDLAPPCGFSAEVGALLLPMFTDPEGTKSVMVPLHGLRLQGSLSADHRCIGAFDSRRLDSCCDPLFELGAFREGGAVEGYFLLEETDAFNAGIYEKSLCVLLSDDIPSFGDGALPFEHCKRDAQGKIVFQGDWCSATNAPATADCADALRFAASFAASGVPFVE